MKLLLALCLTLLPCSAFADQKPDAQKSKKQLLAELQEYKAQLARRVALIKAYESELEAVNAELEDFKQNNSELRARLENEASKKKALNRAVDKSEAEVAELATENAKLKKLLEARGRK